MENRQRVAEVEGVKLAKGRSGGGLRLAVKGGWIWQRWLEEGIGIINIPAGEMLEGKGNGRK